ncbi:CDK5 regulatory subunit-associated protein 2 [Discoglossus pictus]
MDSVPGEDPTIPLDLSSAQISLMLDAAGGQDHYTVSSGFGSYVNDQLSLNRAHTMKDFEMQIADLKKENFNLKLRIYFLEEQVQQKCDGSSEDLYRMNIELKVEVESLKYDLQEKQNLLIKASKAVESLAGDSGSKIKRLKEENLQRLQEVEGSLNQKIFLLEKQVSFANEEVEKIGLLLDQERLQRIDANEKLSAVQEQCNKDNAEMEERERMIDQLNGIVRSKEALIVQLQKQLSTTKPYEGSADIGQERKDVLSRDSNAKMNSKRKSDADVELGQNSAEGGNSTPHILELQRKLQEMDNLLNDYQQKLQEKEAEISLQKKNAFKRDKTIQGLTVALKTKDKENDELMNEIEKLNNNLAKARESVHKAQLQNFKGVEDYQEILVEKEKLLTRQHASLMEKEQESRKLRAALKRKDEELNDLYQQREQLSNDLDEAQQVREHDDKTINDLKNQLEKLNHEMLEKENALQLQCNIIINEHKQQFHDQEIVIKQLGENLDQKIKEFQESKEKLQKYEHPVLDATDNRNELEQMRNELNIKEECIHKLKLAIQERDQETKHLVNKCKNIQQVKDDIEKKLLYQIKEKDFIIADLQELLKTREPEGEKEPEYRLLIRTLKAEQEMYSQLIKTARGAESLQKELDNITLLRRRLEADIQENQELRRILKEQIMTSKWKENDSISFLGDQTSYFSICVDNLDQQADHLSLEELRGKVTELMLVIKEMQSNAAVKIDLEHSGNFGTKETQTDAFRDSGLFKKSEDELAQMEDSQRSTLLIDFHQSMSKEALSLDDSTTRETKSLNVKSPVTYGVSQAILGCELGKEASSPLSPSSSHNEHDFGLRQLSINQRESTTDHENTSIVHDDVNVGNVQSIFANLRQELDDLKQKYVAQDNSEDNLDAASNIGNQKASEAGNEGRGIGDPVRECEKEQILPNSKKIHQAYAQGDLGKKPLKKVAKKSCIPVPLKHLSHTKLDKETFGMSCEVQDHIKLQTELQICQLQKHRLSEQLQCFQIEIERLRINEKVLKGMDTSESAEKSHKQGQDTADVFFNEGNTKHPVPTPKGLHTAQEYARLQEMLEICQQQNRQLSEKLQSAEKELETFKENEIFQKGVETSGCLDNSHKQRQDESGLFLEEDNPSPNPDNLHTEQEYAQLQEELEIWQQESQQLSEKLQSAEIEIEKLKANETLLKGFLDNSHKEVQDAPEVPHTSQEYARLQEELEICQQQNHQLSEKLQSAEIEMEKVKANKILLNEMDTFECPKQVPSPMMHHTEDYEWLQEELGICQQQNFQLLEKLQSTEIEIEKLKENEILLKEMDTLRCLEDSLKQVPILEMAHTEEEYAQLQEKMDICQQQNLLLSEKLQIAEAEIDKLKASENLLKEMETLHCLENSHKLQDSEIVHTEEENARLQKELEICLQQNLHLTEKLQSTELEIEKMKSNEILLKDISTLIYLDDSHKEADPAEHSFDADKTITNLSANEMRDGKADVERGIFADNLDEAKSDMGGLRSHPDGYNKKTGPLILQTCTLEDISRAQEDLKQTGSPYSDPSLSRYNLLVQSQARELSAQRQQIKESHSLSVHCCRNFINVMKAFEELLQASDVDFYVAEGFREQLNQSITWVQKLEYRLANGDLSTDPDIHEDEIKHRYNVGTRSRDRVMCYQFTEGSESHLTRSEVEISKIVYVGSSYHNQEIVKNNQQELPQNLLIEHLEEIRKLRQRLEVSINTNDMLRKQLERQITEAEQGVSAYGVHKGPYSELVSEIYQLRKQNEAFKYLLAKESRDKEIGELRDTLSKKDVLIEHLTHDCERMKKDNEKMKQIIGNNEREIGRLSQELASNCKQLARQQSELNLQQHQMAEQDQLLRSLRIELKVYEHFSEREHRKSGVKAFQQGDGEDPVDHEDNDYSKSLNLNELLEEIQCLRVQLERSIRVSHALHQRLKEQLSKDVEGNVSVNYYLKGDTVQHMERNIAFHDVEDSYSDHTGDSSSYTPSRLVPGHRMWADKRGRHVLGLLEDFNALRKQISEGGIVLQELEAYFGHDVQALGFEIPNDLENMFSEKIRRTRQSLEEARRLTKLLWRVTLPANLRGSHGISQDEETMRMEILRLRKKISEQEKKFSGTVKHLRLENQMKGDIERVILDQLALTHEVLKKARGNLEMQPTETPH